jgi:hypothetical protein
MRVAVANLGKTVRCPACHARISTRAEERVQVEWSEPRPDRRGEPDRKHARKLMREATKEDRYRRADYGMPWYLWILAALPWGIPVLTRGGCIPVLVAAGISAGCFAIARATRVPIVYRVLWLVAIDAVSFMCLVILLVMAFALSYDKSISWRPWQKQAGLIPQQSHSPNAEAPAPALPEPPPKPKPHKEPPSAEQIPGLIAYWDFDEKADGVRVKDRTGHGSGGTLHGATPVDGVRGQGLHFDGRESYCELGDGATLNFASGAPFTIAGWVRTQATTGTIVSMRNSRDDGSVIDITVEGGKIKGLVRENGGIFPTAVTSRVTIHDDSWHHFAVSRSSDGEIELFVDGDSQGKRSGTQSRGAITTDMRALGSERYWVKQGRKAVDGASAYLGGGIDEVCIANRVLTAEEIRTLAGQ